MSDVIQIVVFLVVLAALICVFVRRGRQISRGE
jgi:hypothetical protein